MTPEVQLWKPPEGMEALSAPKELEAPRNHIIYMCAHLMKLYGLKRISVNVSMVGPCGATSPELEAMAAFEGVRPAAFKSTEITVVRSLVPLMMVYGIVGITISLDDKDKNEMLKMWASMADAVPKKGAVTPPTVIEGEGHGKAPA